MADYWAVAARHNVARPTEPGLVGDLEVMAAADAAFPGLPAGMTAGEEARRVRAALEAVAGGLRARWVAEALDTAADQIAGHCEHKDYRSRGAGDTFEERWPEPRVWPADSCPFCSKDTELVRKLAAEYREGTR